MIGLQHMIDQLNMRAVESDLIALLATCRRARLYNADMARELHQVVAILQKELDRRRAAADRVPTPVEALKAPLPTGNHVH